jgi:6-phosphogluconolactonase
VTDIRSYDTREQLMQSLAETVADELRAAIEQNGSASLAVPGGTTPEPFFLNLRKQDLDWGKVFILLTDERFVPESSPRSNSALIRRSLLQEHAARATYVPLYMQGDAPEEVLQDLCAGLDKALPLDVCVLGMGADMHTASLFPGADLLAEALSDAAPALLPMRAPGAPEPRLTLTAPVLKAADAIHLLIAGEEKKAALKQAMDGQDEFEAPVRVILNRSENTTVHYAG